MEDLGEIVQEFLVESHENLDQLDRDLVALEQEPNSRDLLSRIFRTIHTIKGTSGFLAFNRLETLTHAGESLLSRLRDGVQPVTPETITTLLAMVDGVRSLLATIEETGAEGDVDVDDVIAMVNAQIADGSQTQRRGARPAAAERPPRRAAAPAEDRPRTRAASRRGRSSAAGAAGAAPPSRSRASAGPLGELLVEAGARRSRPTSSSALQQPARGRRAASSARSCSRRARRSPAR